MNTKNIAFAVLLGALYVSIGFAFQSISFGNIQVRIADALYPLICVFGCPALLGLFGGHLLFNLYGVGVGIALGLGDVVSPFVFLIPKVLMWKLGKRGYSWVLGTTMIHVVFVAVWVAWLLYTMFGLPFWLSVATVGAGEFIAEIVMGGSLAVAIKKQIEG